MVFLDTSVIIIGTTLIFLLVGTAVIYKFINILPFAKMYRRLRSHYKDHCPIFTTPPPTYEAFDKINKEYGQGRINAIISEYFLFAVVVVFMFFTVISYFLYSEIFGSWLVAKIGVTINPLVGKEIFNLIIYTPPFEGIIFFILAPQLIINPYLNYFLMRVLFVGHKIPPLYDNGKFSSLTDYISLDLFWRNFIYGSPCIVLFYLSAKIILVIIFGLMFVSIYSIYVTGVCLAFSITFMLACRAIALLEMFSECERL